MIQRYSTPRIHISVDTSIVRNIWVTISELDREEILTKDKSELVPTYDGYFMFLTQEDTEKLPEGRNKQVLLQARVLFADGSEIGSDIMQVDVGEVLKDGIME